MSVLRMLVLMGVGLFVGGVAHAAPLALAVDPLVRNTWVGGHVTGANAGEQVWFIRGSAQGAGPCPAALGGQCVDVLNPVVVGYGIADTIGEASVYALVPPAAPPGTYVFQAVAVRGAGGVDSVTSNVVAEAL